MGRTTLVDQYLLLRDTAPADQLELMWGQMTEDEQLVVRCLVAGIPLEYLE